MLTSVPWAAVFRPAARTTEGRQAEGRDASGRDRSPNGLIGWALLVAGFAWAAWLDPWSLSETDPAALAGSHRMATRHAQAVVLGMAFLQLLVAHLHASAWLPLRAVRLASWLVAVGAVLYALGYGLSVHWAAGAWLIPLGALLNLAGFASLAWVAPRRQDGLELRAVLLVIAFGMLLDELTALFALRPDLFLPGYLGPEDGVRQRMLRLARAAAIALPVVTLLYRELAARHGLRDRVVRWGRAALLAGMVGMPLTLAAAAATTPDLKYLLELPAWALLAGTLAGVRLAWAQAGLLESWGWSLVATSMVVGILMGAYAFDGPFEPPRSIGGYNELPRRLTRLAHAYTIVLGLTSIFVARRLSWRSRLHRSARLAALLLAIGTVTTVGAILVLPTGFLPIRVLSVGPTMIAVATGWCVVATVRVAHRATMALPG